MHTAFSRDGSSLKKVYVQQRVEESGAEIMLLLEKGAVIFIAGNSKMPKGVLEALQAVLERESGMSAEQSKAYIADLQKSKRLVIEAWS